PSKNFGVWPHPNCLPFVELYKLSVLRHGADFIPLGQNVPKAERTFEVLSLFFLGDIRWLVFPLPLCYNSNAEYKSRL
ncbi:hypothetical protein, partial [Pseudoflavonifractor sp. 524-17]|uniref:hypothetical protein n=1 Tax=Pseudoflavonifractor sp. 524-17 TaxID=2304577 RepID=UPI001A9AC56E